MDTSRPLDSWIAAAERALRALGAPAQAARPLPGAAGTAQATRSPDERRRSAGLLAVNQSG